MGLITFVLLAAFTALYVSKSLDKKPEPLQQFVDKMMVHITEISTIAVVYGIIASLLTIIMVYNTTDMLVRLLSDILLAIMGWPFIFDKFSMKFNDKVN